MTKQTSATVKMTDQGRVTIPKEVREALGVVDEAAYLDLDIRVIEHEQ